MRLLLGLVLGAAGAWLVLRRREQSLRHVVVAWQDGSELVLDPGSEEGERLVALARQALP